MRERALHQDRAHRRPPWDHRRRRRGAPRRNSSTNSDAAAARSRAESTSVPSRSKTMVGSHHGSGHSILRESPHESTFQPARPRSCCCPAVSTARCCWRTRRRHRRVWPVYVLSGLAWEALELAMVEHLLGARRTLPAPSMPLMRVEFTMHDVYAPSHWALRGRAAGLRHAGRGRLPGRTEPGAAGEGRSRRGDRRARTESRLGPLGRQSVSGRAAVVFPRDAATRSCSVSITPSRWRRRF